MIFNLSFFLVCIFLVFFSLTAIYVLSTLFFQLIFLFTIGLPDVFVSIIVFLTSGEFNWTLVPWPLVGIVVFILALALVSMPVLALNGLILLCLKAYISPNSESSNRRFKSSTVKIYSLVHPILFILSFGTAILLHIDLVQVYSLADFLRKPVASLLFPAALFTSAALDISFDGFNSFNILIFIVLACTLLSSGLIITLAEDRRGQ
ncbi:hypothetical protein Lepto7375DRAFT_0015 [Leptolyngbya sp. PCC 7375]|nr:hypothetical protein Lepto7375DRAFT_0015 [Leptolyngbya sp. PCC 7375]